MKMMQRLNILKNSSKERRGRTAKNDMGVPTEVEWTTQSEAESSLGFTDNSTTTKSSSHFASSNSFSAPATPRSSLTMSNTKTPPSSRWHFSPSSHTTSSDSGLSPAQRRLSDIDVPFDDDEGLPLTPNEDEEEEEEFENMNNTNQRRWGVPTRMMDTHISSVKRQVSRKDIFDEESLNPDDDDDDDDHERPLSPEEVVAAIMKRNNNTYEEELDTSNHSAASADTGFTFDTDAVKCRWGSSTGDETGFRPVARRGTIIAPNSDAVVEKDQGRWHVSSSAESGLSSVQRRDSANENVVEEPSRSGVLDYADYGYGEDYKYPGNASPDFDYVSYGIKAKSTLQPGVLDKSDYGYGDASPDVSKLSRKTGVLEIAKYEYGDARPDSCENTAENKVSLSPSSGRASICGGRDVPPKSALKRKEYSHRRASLSVQKGRDIEVSLPGQQKSVRKRCSITFASTVDTKDVTPVHELLDEPEKLWFQHDEMEKMKMKRQEIVEKVRSSTSAEQLDNPENQPKPRKLCIRGLETMLEPEHGVMLTNLALNSVLKEQSFQQKNGYFDGDYVAKMYSFATQKSRIEAAQRAQQDHEAVEGYLNKTRRACRRYSC